MRTQSEALAEDTDDPVTCDDMPYCSNYTKSDCGSDIDALCPKTCGHCPSAKLLETDGAVPEAGALLQSEITLSAKDQSKCCSAHCTGHNGCASGLFCCPHYKMCMGMDWGMNIGPFCSQCTERKRMMNVDEDLPILRDLAEEEVSAAEKVAVSCSTTGGVASKGPKVCDGNTGTNWGVQEKTNAVEPSNIGISFSFTRKAAGDPINGVGIFVPSASWTTTVRDLELRAGGSSIARFEVDKLQGWQYFGGFSTPESDLGLTIVTNHGYSRAVNLFEVNFYSGVDLIPPRGDQFETLTGGCTSQTALGGKVTVRAEGECEAKCLEEDACVAYVSNGEYCYLKRSCSGTAGQCTGHCAYRLKGLKGKAFEALATRCMKGSPVGGRIEVSTVAECENECAANSKCKGFNTNGQHCYLKGNCVGENGDCTGNCGFRKL